MKSKVRNRLSHSKAEKSLYVAINKRLAKPLDQHDPGYAYAVWTSADEQYDTWIRDALATSTDSSSSADKPVFKCYLEDWEVEARKNDQVNHFKVDEKLRGLYFFDDDPEEDEEPAHYLIHALFWPKGARGSNRLWNADCSKVATSGPDGEYLPVLAEGGETESAVYVVNEALYSMIKAAWHLNESQYVREDGPGDEEDA